MPPIRSERPAFDLHYPREETGESPAPDEISGGDDAPEVPPRADAPG
jgi:cytochrome c oxidase subunit 1